MFYEEMFYVVPNKRFYAGFFVGNGVQIFLSVGKCGIFYEKKLFQINFLCGRYFFGGKCGTFVRKFCSKLTFTLLVINVAYV